MSPRILEAYLLNQSARTANNDFETEGSVGLFDAVRGMVRKKFLRALTDLLLGWTLNFSE